MILFNCLHQKNGFSTNMKMLFTSDNELVPAFRGNRYPLNPTTFPPRLQPHLTLLLTHPTNNIIYNKMIFHKSSWFVSKQCESSSELLWNLKKSTTIYYSHKFRNLQTIVGKLVQSHCHQAVVIEKKKRCIGSKMIIL